jgi:environmental stress-induced protein Ves
VRLIKAANYLYMPWKNGAGSTTQIAIYPADATTDNFSWRISMAAVTTDGPFSGFPEVERSLVVLDGAGIDLAFSDGNANGNAERLTHDSEPFTFAADAPAYATLVDGPILDLNVMTRRDRFSHRVQRISGPATLKASTASLVLFAHAVGLQIDDGAKMTKIEPGETLIFDDGAIVLRITTENSGDYYLVALNQI